MSATLTTTLTLPADTQTEFQPPQEIWLKFTPAQELKRAVNEHRAIFTDQEFLTLTAGVAALANIGTDGNAAAAVQAAVAVVLNRVMGGYCNPKQSAALLAIVKALEAVTVPLSLDEMSVLPLEPVEIQDADAPEGLEADLHELSPSDEALLLLADLSGSGLFTDEEIENLNVFQNMLVEGVSETDALIILLTVLLGSIEPKIISEQGVIETEEQNLTPSDYQNWLKDIMAKMLPSTITVDEYIEKRRVHLPEKKIAEAEVAQIISQLQEDLDQLCTDGNAANQHLITVREEHQKLLLSLSNSQNSTAEEITQQINVFKGRVQHLQQSLQQQQATLVDLSDEEVKRSRLLVQKLETSLKLL